MLDANCVGELAGKPRNGRTQHTPSTSCPNQSRQRIWTQSDGKHNLTANARSDGKCDLTANTRSDVKRDFPSDFKLQMPKCAWPVKPPEGVTVHQSTPQPTSNTPAASPGHPGGPSHCDGDLLTLTLTLTLTLL